MTGWQSPVGQESHHGVASSILEQESAAGVVRRQSHLLVLPLVMMVWSLVEAIIVRMLV